MSNGGFVKLYHTILDSSIWLQPNPTRIVWITMLAMADANGVVIASIGGLAHRANVTRNECEEALLALHSPDPDSKSSEFEGRRVEKIEGGWLVLNHGKYREMRTSAQIATAERVKRHREQKSVTGNTGAVTDPLVTTEAEAYTEEDQRSEKDVALVARVFEFWRQDTGHYRTTLDSKRRGRIKARIREGFTYERMTAAIVNRRNDPFLMGQNDTGRVFDGIETLLRDAAQVERLEELSEPMKPRAQSRGQQPKQPNSGAWKPPVEKAG